jgi:hypothetical protein
MLSSFVGDVRRNHALEHATVQLLLAKLGPTLRLVGRASGDGFFIYGRVPPADVADCARDALTRLQRGEAAWAVTPLCGTNIATAGILASLATLAASKLSARSKTKDRLSNSIVASVMAVALSQPIGRLIQEHLTTSPDLAQTEILSIESREDGKFHKVRTRRTRELATASL